MIEASKAVVGYVRNTSTPAVCCAATEQLGSHPKGENSLKNPQEIRTRSDAHGSISIQEGQPYKLLTFRTNCAD